jgi:hypothetical protein
VCYGVPCLCRILPVERWECLSRAVVSIVRAVCCQLWDLDSSTLLRSLAYTVLTHITPRLLAIYHLPLLRSIPLARGQGLARLRCDRAWACCSALQVGGEAMKLFCCGLSAGRRTGGSCCGT